jgi:hypothetical protein
MSSLSDSQSGSRAQYSYSYSYDYDSQSDRAERPPVEVHFIQPPLAPTGPAPASHSTHPSSRRAGHASRRAHPPPAPNPPAGGPPNPTLFRLTCPSVPLRNHIIRRRIRIRRCTTINPPINPLRNLTGRLSANPRRTNRFPWTPIRSWNRLCARDPTRRPMRRFHHRRRRPSDPVTDQQLPDRRPIRSLNHLPGL